MSENNKGGGWNGGFSMPMFKDWVPEKLRPWLYVYLAFTFQLSGGVYIGALNEMMGTMSLMREDLLMCLYSGLCGLAFTFPILFRTKFRFTNRTLHLTSVMGIAACNIAGMFVTWLPLLWVICFIAGCLKLQGTFECMSNIQLWMTPKRDFRVFFPLLHLWIMLSISVSDLLTAWFCHTATFYYMSWFMTGVMLFNALWIFVCTRHTRFMRPLPLLSIDWLGAVLWALTVMQVAYIFCYGEFYDWWSSPTICTLTVTAILTLALAVIRMNLIRHPYIEPKIWHNRRLPGLLLLALIVEGFLATEHVLEEVFYESGMEWNSYTTAVLNYPTIAGVVCACLFGLLWLKVWQRGRVRLIAIGLAVFIAYAMCFYFTVSTEMSISQLYLPVFLRGFAATLLGIVLLYTIQSMTHFMIFFQTLALFQALHLLVGGVIGAACYAFGVRYLVADGIARYGGYFDSIGMPPHEVSQHIGEVMVQLQVAGVKQIYGIVIYAAIILLLCVLIYDIPFTRERHRWMPSWTAVGKVLRRRANHEQTKKDA